jgi:long-subunit acyl-CoA synthetase (AMP-forming)
VSKCVKTKSIAIRVPTFPKINYTDKIKNKKKETKLKNIVQKSRQIKNINSHYWNGKQEEYNSLFQALYGPVKDRPFNIRTVRTKGSPERDNIAVFFIDYSHISKVDKRFSLFSFLT